MGITIPRRGSAAPAAESSGPTRGSRYARNNGATEAPATSRRGGARSAPPEDDAPRRGSSRRGRSEDDAPRRGRGGGDEAAPSRQAQRGWAGSKRTREETSLDADRYKLSELDFDLIAFAENEPFDSAPRHFINDRGYKGQRAFICPGKKGPYKCPICAIGEKPMPVDYFNIAVFDTDPESPNFGAAEMKVWECGPGYSGEIKTQEDSRAVGGDLTSCYFEVKGVKKGNSKATQLEINPVRVRDLKDEWGIDPLSDAEWEDLSKDLKGEGYVQFAPERVMQEAADKLDNLPTSD